MQLGWLCYAYMCILGAFVGPRVFVGPHKLHRTSEWHRAESRMTEFQFQGEQFDDRAAWWRRHDDLSEGNQSASCSAPRWHKGDAFGRLETAASVALQLATTSTERPRYSQAQLNRRADNRLDCFNYGKSIFAAIEQTLLALADQRLQRLFLELCSIRRMKLL